MTRGVSRYVNISAPSNTVVQRQPSSLYSITGVAPAGSIVRVDDTHSFNEGVLDINASSSNTVGHFSIPTYFTNGIGLNTGIVVAVSSNAAVTLEYE